MKPGDALTDDRWVTAVAETRCGQACYVWPDREWRWASELEPTGGAVVAVDKSVLPRQKRELIAFLLEHTDLWPIEIARAANAHERHVKGIAGQMGKRFRAPDGSKDRKKRPRHLGHWWYGYREDDDGDLHSNDQESQVSQ